MTASSEIDRQHLADLIGPMRFCLFITRHENGHLHGRPMTVQNPKLDDGSEDTLWFFMSRRSEPVADLSRDAQVNLAFADMDKDRYVSIAGQARVLDDPAKVKQLWSPMAEAWFPQGAEDPDLALVGVHISHADYWEVKDSKPVQVAKMLKAAVTGQPPKHMGEHGELRPGG